MPTVRVRTGWRGIEDEIDGSHESWRRSVTAVAKELIRLVLENVEWRFANLKKFKWMKLVDPSKFSKQTRLPQKEQRALIEELSKIYQFLVPDVIALCYVVKKGLIMCSHVTRFTPSPRALQLTLSTLTS